MSRAPGGGLLGWWPNAAKVAIEASSLARRAPALLHGRSALPFAPRLGTRDGALLSFVGLLAFVTAQFARAVTWTPGTGLLAAASLGALLAGVEVLRVVLAAAAFAAIAL